ncbi:hypothetical protein ANCDUO_22875 [Ancylostoma duodenale]|uniref:Large ribosomal subunit protein mL54 n=1 Tax=Ancylostoma duodenale TaxID=51022 RepID=A0A0C2FJX0_9BILA|nr:hypothetical protein ANCDUO_22875 [Ancylostoma duodenale]
MDLEVDGPVLDDTADSQASQASTTSGSSLAIQFSVEDLQENNAELPPPQSTETVRSEGKARRLSRRLALANLQLPKLTAKQNCVIDLCTEEDKADDLAWLTKKFPTIKAAAAKSTLKNQRTLKQVLEKKLAERRRVGLAKRKELYMEDNEGLLDEEEEEETETKKSIKAKKRVKEPLGSDEDSEEDEDYNGDDEEEENLESGSEASEDEDDEADKNKAEGTTDKKAILKIFTNGTGEDLPESVDLFDGASTVGSVARESPKLLEDGVTFSRGQGSCETKELTQLSAEDDTTSRRTLHPVDSLNLMLDKDFDAESTPGMTQPTFPNSLSQWFGDKPLEEGSSQEVSASVQAPEFVNIGTFSDMDPFKDSCDDDMLMLCSGRFDTQNLTRPAEVPSQKDMNGSLDHDDDEEEFHRSMSTQNRKRKVIESDDELEMDSPAPAEFADEDKQSGEEKLEESSAVEEPEISGGLTTLRRAVIDSDSDDNVEEEQQEDHGDSEKKEQEEEEDFVDDEVERLEETEGKNYIEEEADDSDDELAVIRRLEKSEFERKANREKWFDDEASLSGDDVGSDLDDDGEVANEYEAEEGDADDVPDSEAIRRQNHRLLLKQEKDREHLELIKLQDRLLADGDLGGTETNRTFRLKLREDVTVMDGEEGEIEATEEEEGETSSQAHAQRVSAIKWLMEHLNNSNFMSLALWITKKNQKLVAPLVEKPIGGRPTRTSTAPATPLRLISIEEEFQKICNEKEEEDIFDIAARSVEISSEVTVSVVSKAPRTLLGQVGLENAIKEIAGATGAKQLYVNNAAQKRPSSSTLQPAKKSRSSTKWMLRSVLSYGRHIPAVISRGEAITRSYAAVSAKVVPTKVDKSAIEEDVEKLATHVCINYFIQEPGPKILPDSEYPAWLFELDLRPPRPLEDLDPDKML